MTAHEPDLAAGPDLAVLLGEYDLARAHSMALVADLSDDELRWRPAPASSAIGWHLGHQAAVNHYLVRNLVAAEPRVDERLDRLFDSATAEVDRGDLPDRADLVAYREAVGRFTHERVEAIRRGDVGAPVQLTAVAGTLLRALVDHEYQHDTWISEMRVALGHDAGPRPTSPQVVEMQGYWMLA